MTGACARPGAATPRARALATRRAARLLRALAALARRPRCASSRARRPLRRAFPRFACAVKLNGNRKVTGTLRGFDQFLNIVLDESVDGATKESMGMVVIRGNSIMLLEPLERIA